MADTTDTTKVVLDLDNAEFVSKLKESLGFIDDLGSSSGPSNLLDTLKNVGIAAGVVGAAVAAFKISLDFTKEAEHVHQVSNSFKAIAEQAGLSADKIKGELITAVQGLATETETLEAGSKAMILLGTNADKVGEIMELARKRSALFGGSVIENFNQLSQALAMGNSRMLKHLGLVVDQKKAYDDFAKSQGTQVEYLTDAGKKQAILNAALDVGKDRFKNVDESTLGVTRSQIQLNVAWIEFKESIGEFVQGVLGPALLFMFDKLKIVMDGLTTMTHVFNREAAPVMKLSFQELGVESASLREKVTSLGLSMQNGFGSPAQQRQLDEYNKRLADVNSRMEDIAKSRQKNFQEEAKLQSSGGADKSKDKGFVDWEKIKSDQEEKQKELLESKRQFQQDSYNLYKQRVDKEIASAQNENDVHELMQRKRLMEFQEYNNTVNRIDQEAKTAKIYGTQQYYDRIFQEGKSHEQRMTELDKEESQAKTKSMDNYAAHSKTVLQGITREFKVQGTQANAELNNMQNLGKISFSSMKSNASDAFKAIGSGSKSLGDAMKGFMFGAIADTAEAQGQYLLASGTGTFNPVQIAEGGALIALASALRSQAGSTSHSVTGGGGSSGGASVPGSADSGPVAGTPTATTQVPQKTVTVQIQGHYFETDQARATIMDMVRQAGDFTDFQYKQIGQS